MPNVTVFISGEEMPSEQSRARFAQACTALCTDILKASLDKVHIIFSEAHHGRGHPAYIEVKYRLETFRPPAVMNAFMEQVEKELLDATGLLARIRCFGYAASDIHGRN